MIVNVQSLKGPVAAIKGKSQRLIVIFPRQNRPLFTTLKIRNHVNRRRKGSAWRSRPAVLSTAVIQVK